MSKRDVQLLLADILDSANKIFKYTDCMTYDQFLLDDMTIDATVRNFEIIGEASDRVPEDYKLQHPEIEWRRMVGLRNRIIHEYFGIDYEYVWTIKADLLPALVDWLETMLEK